jgi:hypothetical protein
MRSFGRPVRLTPQFRLFIAHRVVIPVLPWKPAAAIWKHQLHERRLHRCLLVPVQHLFGVLAGSTARYRFDGEWDVGNVFDEFAVREPAALLEQRGNTVNDLGGGLASQAEYQQFWGGIGFGQPDRVSERRVGAVAKDTDDGMAEALNVFLYFKFGSHDRLKLQKRGVAELVRSHTANLVRHGFKPNAKNRAPLRWGLSVWPTIGQRSSQVCQSRRK